MKKILLLSLITISIFANESNEKIVENILIKKPVPITNIKSDFLDQIDVTGFIMVKFEYNQSKKK